MDLALARLANEASWKEGEGDKKQFVAFLSHYKKEAATDARLLQMELEKIMGRKVMLDLDMSIHISTC